MQKAMNDVQLQIMTLRWERQKSFLFYIFKHIDRLSIFLESVQSKFLAKILRMLFKLKN